jgi:hypothetical protein
MRRRTRGWRWRHKCLRAKARRLDRPLAAAGIWVECQRSSGPPSWTRLPTAPPPKWSQRLLWRARAPHPMPDPIHQVDRPTQARRMPFGREGLRVDATSGASGWSATRSGLATSVVGVSGTSPDVPRVPVEPLIARQSSQRRSFRTPRPVPASAPSGVRSAARGRRAT